MTEPQKYSMATGLPRKEEIKKIPLPAIAKESERLQRDNGFWKFISDHEKSRENWLKKQNENNTEGDKT